MDMICMIHEIGDMREGWAGQQQLTEARRPKGREERDSSGEASK